MALYRLLAMFGAGLFLLGGCATNLPTTTEEITWNIKNHYRQSIMVEFYSQHRNAAWPGGGRAYVLEPGESGSYDLPCRSTEKICYGAWVRADSDIYWGSGMDDQEGCQECCMICEKGSTFSLTLK